MPTPAATLTPADWAGLCALTETSRPEEQLYVLWVIRNRVEAPHARFGATYQDVVLAPSQFSAFNLWTVHKLPSADPKDPLHIFDGVASRYGDAPSALLTAVHLAEYVLDEPIEHRLPHMNDVWHYYSPVSMRSAGSKPGWLHTAKRTFTPNGIDPTRFVFAAGVP